MTPDIVPESVYESFNLSSFTRDASRNARFFHPLELVAGGSQRPLLIISFDHYDYTDRKGKKVTGRLDLGVPRVDEVRFTHMNITVLKPGAKPVCRGFGAACLVDTPEGDHFRRRHPEMKKVEQNIFHPMRIWHPVHTLLSANLEHGVPGALPDETPRYADSFMQIELNDWQVKQILKLIDAWDEKTPLYALRTTFGTENCRSFVTHVMEAAAIRKPSWWETHPLSYVDGFNMPNIDAAKIEKHAKDRLHPHNDGWRLQPKAVTAIMAAAAKAKRSLSVQAKPAELCL